MIQKHSKPDPNSTVEINCCYLETWSSAILGQFGSNGGPEFTGRAFLGWARARGIEHILIEPGKPTQNAYIESFNGKFRDECLNGHWFETLAQARTEIAAWRRDYNEVRPHSSCNRMPPAKFAAQHRQSEHNAIPNESREVVVG